MKRGARFTARRCSRFTSRTARRLRPGISSDSVGSAEGFVMAKGVYYSGDVQGVGFRATAVSIARRHPGVRGWVRNLADGRVELFADGPTAAVDDFLADLREYMADHI